jgi:hypothetical protein
MKPAAISGITLSALVLSCAALLAIGFGGLNGATMAYPKSMPASGLNLSVDALQHGNLSWGRTYYTRAQLTTVWRYYARHFEATPEAGIGRDGRCITLTAARHLAKLRHEVSVSLCPVQSGTRISVGQSLYLLP